MSAHPPAAELWLDVGGVLVQIRSNSGALIHALGEYFGELVVVGQGVSGNSVSGNSVSGSSVSDIGVSDIGVSDISVSDISVVALEAPPPSLPFTFRPWAPGVAESRRKESVADTSSGRVVRKLRTGMQFLSSSEQLIVVGPCLKHVNQVINFIVSQYITLRLREGWALCHAAGVSLAGRGLGIAARAGGGKSTLALWLLSSGLFFVSNDRLLVKQSSTGASIVGVPKMPRVNPGTLLHNPDLIGILPAARREALRELSPGALWALEEKYDVMVDEVYGSGRCRYRASLEALLVLSWSPVATSPTRFDSVRLEEREDLLDLVMKPPGVFHQDRGGQHASALCNPHPHAYMAALSSVKVWEATGKADFELGVRFCRRLLESQT